MESFRLGGFCIQLALLIKSGIPVLESIETLYEDEKDEKIKASLKKVYEALKEYKTLDEALEEADVFPRYMIERIKAGDKAGRLEEVIEGLGTYYERENELKNTLQSAIKYPLLLTGMMVVVALVLILKVLPIFEEVFESLGGGLTPTMRMLMHLGRLISQYALGIGFVALVLLICIYMVQHSEKGHETWEKIKPHGKLSKKIAVGRLASHMSLMLKSGLDVREALEGSLPLIEEKEIKIKVENIIKRFDEGADFIEELAREALFSHFCMGLIRVGSKTGHLEEMMEKVASRYEIEVEEALAKRVALIEPLSVASLSILIGGILIAVMLPLMSVMSSIG